jgi:biopolymer transport protein ExbD
MNAEQLRKKVSPSINVTPLIDVLLVLLIIFMVVTPIKPSRFKTLIPEPPQPPTSTPPQGSSLTLVVTIKPDGHLELNKLGVMGSVNEMGKLSAKLGELFRLRLVNHTYRRDMMERNDLPEEKRIERTVFIKAPRSIAFGEVTKVIDGIRGAGAEPVGLQIDELD